MPKTKLYAIVDLETTGGLAKRDKITEIGIVISDGKEVLDTYQSLIYPERSIPSEITRITGITDSMVQDAPKFYEVAKEVVQLTEGKIFVAHNVRFDYSFLREEFGRLGFTYTRRQLDTVRLARTHFPGLRSYSLGNLIKEFGIKVSARHRALDDAVATTELLHKILASQHGEISVHAIVNAGIRESKLPAGITLDILHALPETPGVYYFYNEYKKVIYVGKSINIKSRVMQHFSKMTPKAERMAKMVHSISYEETGSELIALLLESREIKYLSPEINKAQRTKHYPYFIHCYYDAQGYLCYEWLKSSIKRRKNKVILGEYGSKVSAQSRLNRLTSELQLCLSKMNIYDREGPCYHYNMHKCLGACCGMEDATTYNERAELGKDILKQTFTEDFIIKLPGRISEEIGVVLVEEGNYKGYGYIDISDYQYGIEEIKEAIQYEPENPEVNRIVATHLHGNAHLEIIKI